MTKLLTVSCWCLLQWLLLLSSSSRTSHAWVTPSSCSVVRERRNMNNNHNGGGVTTNHRCQRRRKPSPLQGRVMDSGADFFRERRPQGDFFLGTEREGATMAADEEFGPGPALIFYNVPQGIQDEELVDMLRDGAPKAIKKGVSLLRMDTSTTSDWMDMSLEDALKKVVRQSKDPSFLNEPDPLTTDAGLLATTPVLFFSGFTNREMMSTFQIISHEVHKETQGRLSVACAMAMPNSMSKCLRQVLLDVSGDHLEVNKPRSKKP